MARKKDTIMKHCPVEEQESQVPSGFLLQWKHIRRQATEGYQIEALCHGKGFFPNAALDTSEAMEVRYVCILRVDMVRDGVFIHGRYDVGRED